MDQSLNLISLLIVFGVVFGILLVVFLVCREAVCWYWKVNKSVELMEQILVELKKNNTRV